MKPHFNSSLCIKNGLNTTTVNGRSDIHPDPFHSYYRCSWLAWRNYRVKANILIICFPNLI